MDCFQMVLSVNESVRKSVIFKQVEENVLLSHLGHEKSRFFTRSYLLKVIIICSKLTAKIPEWRSFWCLYCQLWADLAHCFWCFHCLIWSKCRLGNNIDWHFYSAADCFDCFFFIENNCSLNNCSLAGIEITSGCRKFPPCQAKCRVVSDASDVLNNVLEIFRKLGFRRFSEGLQKC